MEVNAFNKKLKFENEHLEDAYNLAKEAGYKTYIKNPVLKDIITYFYVDNGKTFGYIQAHFGGISYSTRHKPNPNVGTSFNIFREPSTASLEKIEATMAFAPEAVYKSLLKYVVKQTFKEFSKNDNLSYKEI